MVVALGGVRYRAAHFDDAEEATLVAAVMLSGAASNLQPALPLGQLDQNVQWNVWNRISTARLTNHSESSNGAGLDIWRAAATNR